ncbi:hypothetical protein N9L68_02335 [bacterium]|nr:hypothetical protein [bacterium]
MHALQTIFRLPCPRAHQRLGGWKKNPASLSTMCCAGQTDRDRHWRQRFPNYALKAAIAALTEASAACCGIRSRH